MIILTVGLDGICNVLHMRGDIMMDFSLHAMNLHASKIEIQITT